MATQAERIEDLERRVKVLEETGIRPHKPTANDEMLDGPYGNPVIRKDPRDWTGKSYQGYKMSDADPAYLDMLAKLFDWMADQDDKTGKRANNGQMRSGYSRKDAALARGWALRLRTPGYAAKPKGQAQFEKDYQEALDDKIAAPPEGTAFAEDDPEIPF
jgi:hypothetical protein